MHFLIAPLFAVCIVAAAASTPLIIVDSVQHAYVRQGPDVALDKASASSLVAAATGLMPGSAISADLSRQFAGIFKPSPLAKPRAFVTLNVGGLSAGTVGDIFAHRAHRTIQFTGDGCAATSLVHGLGLISATNPSAKLTVVDQAGLQNCNDGCVEKNLAAAAEDAYLDVSELDLSQKEALLFVVELGSVYAGLKGQLMAVRQRNELNLPQDDVELYEVSIMGLHALAKVYGQDSNEVSAASSAVLKLLKWAVDALDAAYEGDAVYQVLFMQTAPARVETLAHLASWKDLTRRQLLAVFAVTFPDVDEETQARLFSVKAAGYGSFILLVYFTLAAIWCMCNMPFKQDTLLYGSKKDQ